MKIQATRIPNTRNISITISGVPRQRPFTMFTLGILESDGPRGLCMTHLALPERYVAPISDAIADAPTADEWTVTL